MGSIGLDFTSVEVGMDDNQHAHVNWPRVEVCKLFSFVSKLPEQRLPW